MKRPIRATVLYSAVVLGLTACEFNQSTVPTKLQYMPDMADAPTAKAQENYLEPPEHSVPINGVLYPATVEEAEKTLQNPFPPSEQILAEGKHLYETVCVACHGADGSGKHQLGKGYPDARDIRTAVYKERKDGFFFHRITFGLGTMPGYGHSTSPHERWKIIHYVRTLQK